MLKPNRNVALTLLLAGIAVPAVAALPQTDFSRAAPRTQTAIPADAGQQQIRVADDDRHDDDDEDGWRRSRRDRGPVVVEGRGWDDEGDDEDCDDEDDNEGECRTAPRRTGPAPAQNPLIGAPRAKVN